MSSRPLPQHLSLELDRREARALLDGRQRDDAGVAGLLITAGVRRPERVRGSDGVQEVLHRAGVPDPD